MAKLLKFKISLTQSEWDIIRSAITANNEGRRITHFLHGEMQKTFHRADDIETCIPAEEVSEKQVAKFFEINISDKIIRQIRCKAKKDRTTAGEYLKRLFLIPKLESKSTS